MDNKKYMELAIELAKKGIGFVDPNPLVGAVIVKDNRIIATGYHKRYGELHAEREALSNLTESAIDSDMYVTLEPCCHYGKQPPCVDAIISHKIKRVFVGSDDPNLLVSGKGYAKLRENGIEVITHFMKAECDKLNDVFFHYIINKTPYVVMKYAMTLDGKIATKTGESKWISGEASRKDTQSLRNKLTAIMVGIGTVIQDNPMLNSRLCDGRNPIRIICDSNLGIPIDSQIIRTAKEIPTYIAILEDNTDSIKQELLIEMGVNIIKMPSDNNKIDLKKLMKHLGGIGINSILLEGGGTLNYSMLEAGLVNELNIYIAPKIFGGRSSITPVEGEGVDKISNAYNFILSENKMIEEDIFLKYIKG